MVTITDNIRNAYTNKWKTGEETPLGGKIWDYENGEVLSAYVCLRVYRLPMRDGNPYIMMRMKLFGMFIDYL